MMLQEFRHHVLALLMVSDPFCTSAATMLAPRFFDNPSEQHLVRFALEYFRQYHKAPRKMAMLDQAHAYFNTAKHLKPQLDDFTLLLDVVGDLDASAANQAEYLLNRLRDFCKEAAMKDALLKSVEDIQNGRVDDVLARVQKAMLVGADTGSEGLFLLADAGIRQTVEEARFTIATGLTWMDEPTRGGVARGELGIIMSPPNTGKTTVLINLGVGIMKNKHKVAHFSCEMAKGIIRAKYDQCLLRKTDDQLSALDKEGYKKIAQWLHSLQKNIGSDVYIQDFPPNRLTIEGIRAHLLLLKSRHGFAPDALLIDYMDIMAMPTHIKESYLQLAWVGVELRALAAELGMATYTVTQTTRGGSTKETSMGDDVSGDFTKVATCDFLASLNQTPKEVEEEIARMFWIKTRFGGKHRTYRLLTDFERSLLSPA